MLFIFDVEIWGTVADWVMIVFTIVTAYFFWETLKSQIVVQSAQQELTKIEHHRHAVAIKPNFALRGSEFNDNYFGGWVFHFVCENAEARNFRLTITDPEKGFISPALSTQEYILPSEDFTLILEGDEHQMIRNTDLSFAFVLRFEDIEGRKYKQYIMRIVSLDGTINIKTRVPFPD